MKLARSLEQDDQTLMPTNYWLSSVSLVHKEAIK